MRGGAGVSLDAEGDVGRADGAKPVGPEQLLHSLWRGSRRLENHQVHTPLSLLT